MLNIDKIFKCVWKMVYVLTITNYAKKNSFWNNECLTKT